MLPGVLKCPPGMPQPMEMIPGLCRMLMPVIEEQIMEHPSPGCPPGIQSQTAAEAEIIIGHVQTVLIARGRPVLDIFLHLLDHRKIGRASCRERVWLMV